MPASGKGRANRVKAAIRVENLPQAIAVARSRIYSRRPCPQCGRRCYRNRTVERTLHDFGDLVSKQPRDIHLTYSQHYCCKCHRYFDVDTSDLASPKTHYTHRVITLAVRVVMRGGFSYRAASRHLWKDHRVFVPFGTIQNWVEARKTKTGATRS